MNKIKSPLKHNEDGHMLLRPEIHIEKHSGDAVAAGYEESKEEEPVNYKEYKIPVKEDTEDSKKENKNIGIEGSILDANDLEALEFIQDPDKREVAKQKLIEEKTLKENEEVNEELEKYKNAGKADGSSYTNEELGKIEKRLKLNVAEGRQTEELVDRNGIKYDPRIYMLDEKGSAVKKWNYYTQGGEFAVSLEGQYYHPSLGFMTEEKFNAIRGDVDVESFVKENNIKTPEQIKRIRTRGSVEKELYGEGGSLTEESTGLDAVAEELNKLPFDVNVTTQDDFGFESITLHAPNLIGVKGPDGKLLVDKNGKRTLLYDEAWLANFNETDVLIPESELGYILDALEEREETSFLNNLGYIKEGELDDAYGGDDVAVNKDLGLLRARISDANEKANSDYSKTYKNDYNKILKTIDDQKLLIQESLDGKFNKYLDGTGYTVRVNDNGSLGIGDGAEFENVNSLIKYLSTNMDESQLDKTKDNIAVSYGKVNSSIDKKVKAKNKKINNKDVIEQYLLDRTGSKFIGGAGPNPSYFTDKIIKHAPSYVKAAGTLVWWKNQREKGVKSEDLTWESLYEEVYKQNWYTRPYGEYKEDEIKWAKESFEAVMAIDKDFEKNKEKSQKKIEFDQRLSIINSETEGEDKVIFNKDDGTSYVHGPDGEIIGVAKDEDIEKSEEEKFNAANNLVQEDFKVVDNAQLKIQELGYELVFEYDDNNNIKGVKQITWRDDENEPDEATNDEMYRLKDLLDQSIDNFTKTLNVVDEEFQSIHNARVARQEDDLTLDLVKSQEFIENSYGENWRRRFGSGLDNVTLSIPALLGNDFAKQKLQLNTNQVRFQKEYTWGDSPWYENTGMVFADQGANMLYFMATMGTASAIGLTNNMAMGIAATGVGLQSAGQKRVQHETSQEQAEIAKEHIVNLDLALSQGFVSDDKYKKIRKNLDKTVDLGTMTDAQKWGSIVTTGIIEGGLTYAFGNLGRLNTAKNLNKFFTGARSSTVKNGIMDYGKNAAVRELGKGVGKGLLSENAEELSIHLLTETADALLFEGNLNNLGIIKGDYTQYGKVMIDASIMSGSSNTTSLTYGTVMNHSMRMKTRKEFKDRFDAINKAQDLRTETKLELTKLQQEPKTKESRKKIKELKSTISGLDIEVKTLQEQNILDQQNYAVQVLGIDESTHKKIFETQSQLNNFYIQAGVDQKTLNDPDALIDKLTEYKDKLNAEKKGSGDTWLEGVEKLRKNLDDAQSNWNVKTAANALYGENHKEDGSRKRLQEKLNNKTNTKSKEGKQRAQDHANADEQNKLRIEMEFANEQNLKNARANMESDEKVKSVIEKEVFSEYETNENGDIIFNEKGNPVVKESLDKEAWLEKNGKKRLPKEQREKLDSAYDYYAKNYFAVSKTSMANFDVEGKTTRQVIDEASIITGEEIIFDEVGSYDGLIEKVKELEDLHEKDKNKGLSQDKADQLRKTLEKNREQIEGNSNGFLLGNKFFVIDGNKAKESMKTGSTENMDLTGAVHVHETGHYLDNVTKSIKEISDKGQFIHEYLTNDKNYLSGVLNDKVESRLRRMGAQYKTDEKGDIVYNVRTGKPVISGEDHYLGETETIQDIIDERNDANTTSERQSRIDTVLDEYIREVTTALNHKGFIGLKNEIIDNGRGFFARIRNRDYEVTNAREAMFEVASFLDAVSKGQLSKAYRTQARVATAKGKETAAQERAELQMSNEIQESINKLVRNSKGEVISKEQYDKLINEGSKVTRRKDKVTGEFVKTRQPNPADLITNRNDLLNGSILTINDSRVQGDEIVLVPGILPNEDGSSRYHTKDQFVQMVKDDLTGAITNYNPETKYKGAAGGDLSGWLAQNIIWKRPGVWEKIREEQEALLAAQDPDYSPSDMIDVTMDDGTVVFARKLGFTEDVIGQDEDGNDITRNVFDLIVEEKFDEVLARDPKTYNDTKGLLKAEDAVLVEVLNLVAKEFGINPNKLINDAALGISERTSSQLKINSIGARSMLNMMPEGFNNQADATGVPTVLLNAVNPETGEKNLIYTKQEEVGRVKAGKKQRIGRRVVFIPPAKEGGGKGPIVQLKNFVENINEADYLSLHGITPVGVDRKYRTKDRNVDSPLRATVIQAAMVIANQSIRKIAFEKGLVGLETIKSGKGDLMFSSKIITSNNPTLQSKYYGKNGEKWRKFHEEIDKQKINVNDKKEFERAITRAFDKTWGKDGLIADGYNYRNDVIKDFEKLRIKYVEKRVPFVEEQGRVPESIETFLKAEDSKRDDGFETISKIMGVKPITKLFRENREEHKRFQRTNAIAYGEKYNLSPDELIATMIRNKNFLENGSMKETRGMTFGDDGSFLPSMLLMEGPSYFRSDVSPGYYPQKKTYKGYKGEHKKYFIEEFLNPIHGDTKTITDYTTRVDKKKNKAFVTIKFKDAPSVTVEVTRSYPQATTKQMLATTNKNGEVELNMTQEEIDGRKKDSDEALEFYDNYTAIVAEQAKAIYGENSQKGKEHFAMHMASMNANMKTPLRKGAVFTYAALDAPATMLKNEFNEKNFEFEHGMPAKVVNAMMTYRHWYGEDISLDDIKSAYKVGVLHVDFNDNVGNLFKERMHFNYTRGDNAVKRWFNQFTQIGPSHALYDVFTGEVIGQQQADNWKKIKESNKAFQASKAVNSARLINHDTPSVGISVWDFDDTLATTKSGVRATVPNPDGMPQPGRKVIFLAGGAGSGKSNVVNKLGLENQGFKIVNSDISLEWLKKNSGLPKNMNDLTKEQLSTLGKLQYQSRQISKGKMMKYQGNADGVVVDGTGGSINAMTKLVNEFKDKGYDVSMVFVETSLETALDRNRARKERSLTDKIVTKNHEAVQGNKDGFKTMFAERFMEVNTDNLAQEDAMPTSLTNKMNDFVSGYKKVRLDAEQFATEGADILAQGGEFDFSEFNVVTEGAQGPMFNTAMKRAKKFGTKDTYVLTARPPAAAEPIQQFLAAQGLNIPLENITGLGNSTGDAKAEWMLEKFSEGYNDMYFADDAMQNVEAVKNVLDQLDIKSEVVQAKIQFSKSIDYTVGKLFTNPVNADMKEASSINDVKSVSGLTNEGVYNNIQFSKKHRGEYENLISKRRPDLVKEGLVSETVDNMFNYIDNLDVPADKKRKYERITTKWIATSSIKLNEDSYKIKDAVELSEKYKEDVFSYNNPNEIIEKYASKSKAKLTNPKDVKEFAEEIVKNEKYGITEHVVDETIEGQEAVRKVIDTHWGETSNPWCITQSKNGKLTEEAWDNWKGYSRGSKRIVFQNGKLLAFYANGLYWDRMDNDTKQPVVSIKEGKVTTKVELTKNERVREVITTSEDGNTITTEYKTETNRYGKGTKLIEERVNGKKVKTSEIEGNGTVNEVVIFNKDGKATASYNYDFLGGLIGVNRRTGTFELEYRGDVALKIGDSLSQENFDYDTRMYEFSGIIDLEAQGIKRDRYTAPSIEIGWRMPETSADMKDLVQTIDGKVRINLEKVLEVDPEMRGLPSNIQFSKAISNEFNELIERTTGIEAKKVFSEAQAKIRGKRGKYKGIIPASAQDFMGLLYNFMGKGKQGDADMAFFKKALVDPFARGIDELNASRQAASNDYKNLTKQFPKVKKKLNKKAGETAFTNDQAVRVYLWNKAGFDVPGLSKRDLATLDAYVKNDPELQDFADTLGIISKKSEGYAKPGEYWLVENIISDLTSDGAIGEARADFLSEWQQNADQIFSEENLNKIEAIYGSKFREALVDSLYRMRTGKNRPSGGSRLMNNYMNWVNNSVGAIMFFNVRSAVLQTISATNYINWSDNNPLKAAAAFANQKQFWSDFVMLFNSDYLKQRRAGNRRGVNEADLTSAVKGVGPAEQAKAVVRYLLKIGFLPTQIADSFAIASGGASFYRNRVKTYVKQGMSKAEAEAKAFLDFQETTEVSQQSARPDMISQQQANPLGRLILAFQNTPMQYARIMNKAARDLANGRGDAKTHISKIIYYGAVQSILFGALQSAIFASLGDDEEEDLDKKKQRILNQMIDSVLSGIGYGGKAISTVKNSIMEFLKQRDKGFRADHAYTILQLLGFSPPIGSKLRKIYSAIQTEKFNKDVFTRRGLTMDNPLWQAVGYTIEGFFNVPVGRLAQKMQNIDNALDENNQWWERVALIMGWNTWDLGIKDADIEGIKEEIKEEKKIETKKKRKIKKEEKKKEKEKEEEKVIEDNIEKQKKEKKEGKKEIKCAAVSKSGKRCKTNIEPGSVYCTVHVKVEQGTKEVQCKKIKSNKKRCKMKTKAKSGYCYYHD